MVSQAVAVAQGDASALARLRCLRARLQEYEADTIHHAAGKWRLGAHASGVRLHIGPHILLEEARVAGASR